MAERLTELGADPEDAQWDSRKHGDGSWQVQLAFRAGGRLHIAEWLFDPRRRHVSPADDNAGRLSLPEADLPAPTGGSLGAATVTPIRPRPDRGQAPVVPDPVAEAYEEPARAAAQSASPASFTPARPPVGRPPSGDPGLGGRSNGGRHGSAERRPGGYRTDSPEPGDRDHAADDREGNDTAGRERPGKPAVQETGRPAVQETVTGHVAAPGPDIRDAETGDLGTPPDRDAAGMAGAPAAETSTRPGDVPAAESPAAESPATEATATEAPAAEAATGRAPANGRRPAPAPAPPAPAQAQAPAPAQAPAQVPAPAESPAQPPADKHADEAAPRGRGKKTAGARGRRSSVPSWDEIMLGNSRQPD